VLKNLLVVNLSLLLSSENLSLLYSLCICVALGWHWPTTMSQVSFFFLFHNIYLLLCTLVTLWFANVINHNVIQVLSYV